MVAKIKPLLVEVGFNRPVYQMIKLPLGTWPADPRQKEMGAYLLLNAESAYEAVGTALMTRAMGMPLAEVKAITDGCLKDSRSRRIHCYSKQ